ncbi:MAG: hypothetical protein ACR2JB_01315 [Bryobacteraceae bacterium]
MRKAIVILALCVGCALGQTGVAGQKPVLIQMGDAAEFGPIGITTALAGPMGTVAGAPYSAQATTQRLQLLADGNRIEQTTSGSVARDSQGRVRRDEALPGLAGNNGDAPHIVMIDDPVAHVHWTLDAQTKTAVKMPVPGGKNGGADVFDMAVPPPLGATKTFFYISGGKAQISGSKGQVVTNDSARPDDLDSTKSDLGIQTIEGVPARGTRVTRTIPAGQIGNLQPIVITTESWYSPDLKVLVMSKSNDPRMGETTYKLTNIQRSEPASGLFQPPEDYTVKDQPGDVFFHREIRKK